MGLRVVRKVKQLHLECIALAVLLGQRVWMAKLVLGLLSSPPPPHGTEGRPIFTYALRHAEANAKMN